MLTWIVCWCGVCKRKSIWMPSSPAYVPVHAPNYSTRSWQWWICHWTDDGMTMSTITHGNGDDDVVVVGRMMAWRWRRWWSHRRPDDGMAMATMMMECGRAMVAMMRCAPIIRSSSVGIQRTTYLLSLKRMLSRYQFHRMDLTGVAHNFHFRRWI
mgnify:CR=1 FL=1